MSSDYIIFILGGSAIIIGWFINVIKSLALKRMDDLVLLHSKNANEITEVKERVTIIEQGTVKRSDLNSIMDNWHTDLAADLGRSIVRVHGRIDELYERAPEKKEVGNVSVSKEQAIPVKRHAHDRPPVGR